MTVLAFTGTDGAGKTTQIRRTMARLEARRLTVLRHDKWDVIDAARFPACRFIQASVAEIRDCITQMEGESRAMFLLWAIAATLSDMNDPIVDVHILDGHWYKHAAVESVLGCSPEWIASVASVLPRPDHVLYLRVDPEVALARKGDLTPYECGRDFECSPSRFLSHQRQVTQILDRWAERHGWACVDANRGADRVSEDVDRWVDQWT